MTKDTTKLKVKLLLFLYPDCTYVCIGSGIFALRLV